MTPHFIKIVLAIVLAFLVLRNETGWAKPLRIQTTTTELAWLAQKLGHPFAEVQSFLSGSENPHYVDATPTFAVAAKQADLILAVGADLEVAWLPRVLERSGNPRVQAHGQGGGTCEIAEQMTLDGKRDQPSDRSMGHLHSKGNPHFWYSLTKMREAASGVRGCIERLLKNSPGDSTQHLKTLASNFEALDREFQINLKKLDEKRPQKGTLRDDLVLEMHEDFGYLIHELKLKSAGALEEKPGIKPSAGRLSATADRAKELRVRALLYTSVDDTPIAKKFSEISSLPSIKLQPHLASKGKGETEDYFDVYWKNTESILKILEDSTK